MLIWQPLALASTLTPPLEPAPGTDIPAETHWNAAEMVLHIKQCAGATRKTKKGKGYARSGPQSPQRANRTEKGAEGSVWLHGWTHHQQQQQRQQHHHHSCRRLNPAPLQLLLISLAAAASEP